MIYLLTHELLCLTLRICNSYIVCPQNFPLCMLEITSFDLLLFNKPSLLWAYCLKSEGNLVVWGNIPRFLISLTIWVPILHMRIKKNVNSFGTMIWQQRICLLSHTHPLKGKVNWTVWCCYQPSNGVNILNRNRIHCFVVKRK